jgi:hypothetical protein
MPANQPRLNDYYAPIGKLTMAAATLDDVALRWSAVLSDNDMGETQYKNLLAGLDRNLDLLADTVRKRVSQAKQQSVIDLIEKARTLKNKRNDNVHAVWGEMSEADTGNFIQVSRSRFEKDKSTRTTKWDVDVPTVQQIEALSHDLQKISHELNDRMSHLYDMDEDVRSWREKHGY